MFAAAMAVTVLEELREEELTDELRKREEDRFVGHCDYCHRPPSEPACKFPDRHHDDRIETPEIKWAINNRDLRCTDCNGTGRLHFKEGPVWCNCVRTKREEYAARAVAEKRKVKLDELQKAIRRLVMSTMEGEPDLTEEEFHRFYDLGGEKIP